MRPFRSALRRGLCVDKNGFFALRSRRWLTPQASALLRLRKSFALVTARKDRPAVLAFLDALASDETRAALE